MPALVVALGLSACASHPPEPAATSLPPASPAVETPYFSQTGTASWYGQSHQGRTTASGERFEMNEMTAAHRSLPFDTVVRVTNLENGREVWVRVNDRGPFAQGRVLDLSAAAARTLRMHLSGTAHVRIDAYAADQPNAAATAAAAAAEPAGR